MKRQSIFRACTLLLVMVFLAAVSVGCGKGDDEQAQSGGAGGDQVSITPKYPAALSEESSPWEVAQVLIQALEEDDTPTLLGLVAAKKATGDIDAIYRKYGRQAPASMNEESAIKLVAAGWGATYAFSQPGKTEIVEEKVQENTATVIASVILRGGTAQKLEIKLVREDNLWKVCPGLHSKR